MKHFNFKVFSVYCLVFFVTLTIPLQTFAMGNEEVSSNTLITNSKNDYKVGLMEINSNESKLLLELKNGSKVHLLENLGEFSYVQYKIPESKETIIGYVESRYLDEEIETETVNKSIEPSEDTTNVIVANSDSNSKTDNNEDDSIKPGFVNDVETKKHLLENERFEEKKLTTISNGPDTDSQEVELSSTSVLLSGIALKKTTNAYKTPSRDSNVVKTFDAGSQLTYYTFTLDWYESSVVVNGERQTVYIHKEDVEEPTAHPVLLSGIALKSPTNMYRAPSENSQVAKTFDAGSPLTYFTFTSDWYKSSVTVNGKRETIYIHKNDVEEPTAYPILLSGIALKSPTNMYQAPSENSKVAKAFDAGSPLTYFTFTSDWYKSSVTVNGKRETIYIHKNDVERPEPLLLTGIALKDSTNMYEHPSRGSQALKNYHSGKVLTFYTFSEDWYKSTVNVNGKTRIIYINKNDVLEIEKPTSDPELLEGIALGEAINMYEFPSANSKVLRTFDDGRILTFYTFNSKWYKSTVTVNGRRHTIYIKKEDVELPVTNSELRTGIALKHPTNMYEYPSRNSSVLRSYYSGKTLSYYRYSNNWYKSTVTIDGNIRTIYIHKDDVEQINSNPELLKGIALKKRTNMYEYPSRNSNTLKRYDYGKILSYYSYTDNWYKSTVTANGDIRTIYIHKDDVAPQIYTYYNITLDQAAEMQMNSGPLTDSGSKSGWHSPTKDELVYYLNPQNFNPLSPEYLQFLILSSYAGTDANELNQILRGKGILEGQGAAFIEAAKKYNINELYLISHALLETGNGTSKLANGINVEGKTVYNVYGVGAYDRAPGPDYYGSLYAYSQDWTSTEKAIIGGAQFVSRNYIYEGQNTLYKMRWNPSAMDSLGYASHQYATDIGWATKQTYQFHKMLSLLTTYSLVYDVPVYR